METSQVNRKPQMSFSEWPKFECHSSGHYPELFFIIPSPIKLVDKTVFKHIDCFQFLSGWRKKHHCFSGPAWVNNLGTALFWVKSLVLVFAQKEIYVTSIWGAFGCFSRELSPRFALFVHTCDAERYYAADKTTSNVFDVLRVIWFKHDTCSQTKTAFVCASQ